MIGRITSCLRRRLSKTPSAPVPGLEEAAIRSAISRAYYAAHCATRNFARDRGEIKPSGTAADHELLVNHFQNSPDKERRRVGTFLDRLRKVRNQADYDDTLPTRTETRTMTAMDLAQNALREADTILQTLERL